MATATTCYRSLRILAGLVLLLVGSAGYVRAASVIWAASNRGPQRSIDNGQTWEGFNDRVVAQYPQLTNTWLTAAAIDPKNSSIVYFAVGLASTIQGVLKTIDGGDSWTFVEISGPRPPNGFGPEPDIAIDAEQNNVVYLLGPDGLWRSTDSGFTWSQPALPNEARVSAIGVDPNQSGTIYGIAGIPQPAPGGNIRVDGTPEIYKSSDFGESWNRLAQSIYQTSAGFIPSLRQVFVDPQNSSRIFVTAASSCVDPGPGCGLFQSTDGGTNWQRIGPTGFFKNVSFDPGDGAYYASKSGGGGGKGSPLELVLLKSPDGVGAWSELAIGSIVGGSGPFDVATDTENGSGVYAHAPAGGHIAKSADRGINWTRVTLSFTLHDMAFPSRRAGPPGLTNVSAASFRSGALAPEMIVSAFGDGLATGTEAASATPLLTSLGGTTVNITDSANQLHAALLVFVSPGQVNYVTPGGVAPGAATVTVTAADGSSAQQQVRIDQVSPGVFTLNGNGLVAASVLRVSSGVQSVEDLYQLDGTGVVVPRAINMGPPTDEIYLVVYGTGFRAAGTAGVSVTIGGETATVLYAGPQGTFVGLDQANLLVPRSLANRGDVELVLMAAGRPANAVRLVFRAP